MTAEEIQQIRDVAEDALSDYDSSTVTGLLARAVLALTEQQPDRLVVDRHDPEQEAYQRAKRPALYEQQQPEPVSASEFHRAMWSEWNDQGGDWFDTARELLSRYTITARARLVSSPDGDSPDA